MLFYPTWSLKTHMVNNSMQQEGIKHHQALLEKNNSGSLYPTNLKVVCLFISGDSPMFSLFYISSTLSGKDKEAKVTIATFGNILRQSLQECMSIIRESNDPFRHRIAPAPASFINFEELYCQKRQKVCVQKWFKRLNNSY